MVGRVGARAASFMIAGVAASALAAGTASAQVVDERACTPPEFSSTDACVWAYSYPTAPDGDGSGGGVAVGGVAGASARAHPTLDETQILQYNGACVWFVLGTKEHHFCTPRA